MYWVVASMPFIVCSPFGGNGIGVKGKRGRVDLGLQLWSLGLGIKLWPLSYKYGVSSLCRLHQFLCSVGEWLMGCYFSTTMRRREVPIAFSFFLIFFPWTFILCISSWWLSYIFLLSCFSSCLVSYFYSILQPFISLKFDVFPIMSFPHRDNDHYIGSNGG